jgi:hypothetical protein
MVWYPRAPFAFERPAITVRNLIKQVENEGEDLTRGEVRRQIGDSWVKMSESQFIRAGTVAIVEGNPTEDCEPVTAIVAKREEGDEEDAERELTVNPGYYFEVMDEIEDQTGERPLELWRGIWPLGEKDYLESEQIRVQLPGAYTTKLLIGKETFEVFPESLEITRRTRMGRFIDHQFRGRMHDDGPPLGRPDSESARNCSSTQVRIDPIPRVFSLDNHLPRHRS